MACRILVLRPGTEPVPHAVEVCSLNHWTVKEASHEAFLMEKKKKKFLARLLGTGMMGLSRQHQPL